MKIAHVACVAALVAALAVPPASAQINPWNAVPHGGCCEANIAAWGDYTYVLSPLLPGANQIFRSDDGGRTWKHVYPPIDATVPFGIEGDLATYGPPFVSDVHVAYFGTEVADGVAAFSHDHGETWQAVQIPTAFVANDQAWIYHSRMPVDMCDGVPNAIGYALAGWFRIGSVALFSCDGGLTWPVQTPLIGLNGSGPEHVVCQETAAVPGADTDTRIPRPSFEKMKAHRHGGFGTDGNFYWTEGAGFTIYICGTSDFGATWSGFAHPMALGTAQFNNTVTSTAFDQNGTMYVLHANKLYVSFNQGQAIRHTHTLPRWGNDTSVGDTSGQAFSIDGGTIHIALKDFAHRVWYLRGENVDTANATWTEELVRQGGEERLDFIQIVLDGRGVPTIGYTQPGTGNAFTSSRDLEPIAVDDEDETDQDVSVVIDVLANDFDPDDPVLTVIETSDPQNGSVDVNPDDTVTYTPDPGFSGVDTFTYTVRDQPGLTDEATVTVLVNSIVSVEPTPDAAAFRLGPITPNPTDGSAIVTFELAARADVELRVFTPGGQIVATLFDGTAGAGRHDATWTGRDAAGRQLPAGIYFVRLFAGGESVTERLLHMR